MWHDARNFLANYFFISIRNRLFLITLRDECEFHHVLFFVRDRRVIISHTHRLHPHTPRNSEDSLRSDSFQGRRQSCIYGWLYEALVIAAYLAAHLYQFISVGKNRSLLHDEETNRCTDCAQLNEAATRFPRRLSGVEDARASSPMMAESGWNAGDAAPRAHRHLPSHPVFSAFHLVERRNFSDSIV